MQKRRFNASFAWATEQLFATTFVKKHPNRLFQIGRLHFLEAVDNGDIPSNNHAALEELRTRVACDLKKLKKDYAHETQNSPQESSPPISRHTQL